MTRRDIGTNWNRDNRNNINNNFVELFNNLTKAGVDASEAINLANQALNITESRKGYYANNKGVEYPLKNIVKNGELHSFSNSVKNAILDARVINEKKDKYYTIDFISNGHNGSWGITISEYDAGTYATNASSRHICRYYEDEGFFPAPNEDVVTREIKAEGITFLITIDYSAISGVSLPVNAQAPGAIIDPTLYSHITPLDFTERNRGMLYPLKNMVRDGQLHNYPKAIEDIFLDVKVVNAEIGKLYSVAFLSNGHNDSWGLSINEFVKDNFSSNSSDGMTILHRYYDEPTSEPDEDIFTRVIRTDNGMVFVVTLDYSKVTSTSIHLDGQAKGVVIDESCYIYKPTVTGTGNFNSPVVARVDGDVVSVKTSYSETENMILQFDKLGVNQIIHFKRLLLQEKNSNILDDNFAGTLFYNASTDWISPYRIEALTNGNGNGMRTTGGNHGTDGGGGFPTARHVETKVFADDSLVKDRETVFAREKVVVVIVNHISAYNAIDLTNGSKRDSMKEIVTYTITPNTMSVNLEMVALEPISMKYYQGLGMQKSVWNGNLYYMEDTTNPAIFDVSNNDAGASGTLGEGCEADRWAIKDNGHIVIGYLDSEVGLGTLENLDSTDTLFFHTAAGKVYARTIGSNRTIELETGESLYLSGGYVFTRGINCPGAETAYKTWIQGKPVYVVDFFDSVGSTYLEVDKDDIGKKITVLEKSESITSDNFITSRGLKISSSGYGQLKFRVD